jgi:hypothetical protein
LVDVAPGVERDVDEAMAVYTYLQNKGIVESNLGKVLDACGDSYYDVFTSFENFCKTANLEEIKVVVEKFEKK